ncbi:hypothetical protein M9Y10_021989 [Tritrichomonas musculus]|uniref:VPS9 domain-containing protein n=1 Tax=Tritrichomonas musculus TaxID=1915356 RepID=A0ABR2KRX5_9EUKA
MSVYDKLFQLQLRLKQNKVNQQRKRDEVKRLCQSYENQVYHLIYLLYNFSCHIWYHLTEPNEFSLKDENGFLKICDKQKQKCNNYSELFLNITSIPTEPENKTRLNAVLGVSDELRQLPNDLNNFLNSSSIDQSSILSLPLESFLLVLTLFNFFWSNESSDLFTNFILKLESKDVLKFLQCLIIHPSIQIYFTSALKPIFYLMSSIDSNQNIDLNKALLDSLLEFSPLIPAFFKNIFSELKLSNEEKSKIFYETFLRNYLTNFSAFGIFSSEIRIFHKEHFISLVDTLDKYFLKNEIERPDQISSEKFIENLFSSSQSICIIPNEERLMTISKNYCAATLVDKRSLNLIHNQKDKTPESTQTPFQTRQTSSQILSTPIFFVPHSPVQAHLSTHLGSRLSSDSAVNIASRILLKSDLIHIEDTENKTKSPSIENIETNNKNDDDEAIPVVSFESSSMKPFEYFEKIVDLSFSRVADPQVEVDLDKLEPLVTNMTLEGLCNLIENELSIIEISSNNTTGDESEPFNDFDQDDDIVSTLTSATSAIDPLKRISLYSTQYSLINKMCTFINSQIAESTNTANFLLISKFTFQYIERNSPDSNINESKQFELYYQLAFNDMMNFNAQNENANSLLFPTSISNDNLKLSNTGVNNRISSSSSNVRQMHASNPNSNLIGNSSPNLNLNDRPKAWANIQPDFITHRNFHSCLSYKLDLLNSIKKDEKVIDEANKMKKFLIDNKEKLIDSQQHKFLEIYLKEPDRLKYFNEEFKIAFSSNMPFIRIDHIHQAYQALIGLLQMQGMDEIGADQIIPFAVVSTVLLMTSKEATPEFGNELTFTYTYFTRYIEPFISSYNILNHSQEYSLIQFLSTYQFFHQSMK